MDLIKNIPSASSETSSYKVDPSEEWSPIKPVPEFDKNNHVFPSLTKKESVLSDKTYFKEAEELRWCGDIEVEYKAWDLPLSKELWITL